MPQAFGKNVIGFVSKTKLEESFAESLDEAIRIKIRNKIIEGINSKNILYIQAAHEYCMLMLKDGSHKLVRDSINFQVYNWKYRTSYEYGDSLSTFNNGSGFIVGYLIWK